MTQAEELLKMIETVHPADTAKLDEIDARVWCYLNNSDDGFKWQRNMSGVAGLYVVGGGLFMWQVTKEYTRSRDALKAIRPDGCYFANSSNDYSWGWVTGENLQGWVCTVYTNKCLGPDYAKRSSIIRTEELAELHAIIQAIEYERTQK